jgi:hypothetical protein
VEENKRGMVRRMILQEKSSGVPLHMKIAVKSSRASEVVGKRCEPRITWTGDCEISMLRGGAEKNWR